MACPGFPKGREMDGQRERLWTIEVPSGLP